MRPVHAPSTRTQRHGAHLEGGDELREVQQRRAAARHDALLHGGKGCVLGVLNAQLAVLQLGLGGGADLRAGMNR